MMRFLLFLFIVSVMVNSIYIGRDIGERTVKKDGKMHVFINQDDIKGVLLIVLAAALVACIIHL